MNLIFHRSSLQTQAESTIVGDTLSASEWKAKIEETSTDDPSIFLTLRYRISSFDKPVIRSLNADKTNRSANSCNRAWNDANAGKILSNRRTFLRRQILL